MKIAVIGANGRVGNRITEGLVKHGEDVTAFVRNRTIRPHPKRSSKMCSI
ncbi:NmrA family NAD(P)-binding protein [uncultured Dubosiella sp.]|nr:NmrA family NAD(P)-binding protein [uncultured Dubosiella sp.]